MNTHGLDPWEVSESAEELVTLISEANKGRTFFKVHQEGSIKYVNPEYVGYICPDQNPSTPEVVDEVAVDDGSAGPQ